MKWIYRGIVVAAASLMMACTPSGGPRPAQPVLPTFLSAQNGATAELNESYPTALALQAGENRQVSGLSVELKRAWRDGKQVFAEVCFSLPDSSDWTIWEAHLEYGSTSVSEFSSSFIGMDADLAGEQSRRCDELSFSVPPDADLSASTMTIASVGAYPTPEEYCEIYMPKIRQALVDRGTDIVLECPVVDGAMSLQIVEKPAGISQEEAEQLVFSEEFYVVRGPWSFPVTFAP